MPGRARYPLRAFAASCAIFAVSACARDRAPEPEADRAAADALSGASILPMPLLSLKPALSPLWLEFGPDGPSMIDGPLDSSLAPFEPWPLARRAAGFVSSSVSACVAVNRDGLLVLLRRRGGDLVLYRAADAVRLSPYSIACVFSYRGAPSVLLYRDRFFLDPSEAAPAPRVLSLDRWKPELVAAEPAAFSAYPASQSWDLEALSLGRDGRWLMRASREGSVSYAAAGTLDAEKTDLSAGAYRSAGLPRPFRSADGPLRLVLEAAFLDLPKGESSVAAALREGAPAAEYYLVSAAGGVDAELELSRSSGDIGRAWAWADASRAFLLSPDGSYFAASLGADIVSRGRFPTLPDGFSYTGIAALGETLIASWEEQDGWAVGSAGLVVVEPGK